MTFPADEQCCGCMVMTGSIGFRFQQVVRMTHFAGAGDTGGRPGPSVWNVLGSSCGQDRVIIARRWMAHARAGCEPQALKRGKWRLLASVRQAGMEGRASTRLQRKPAVSGTCTVVVIVLTGGDRDIAVRALPYVLAAVQSQVVDWSSIGTARLGGLSGLRRRGKNMHVSVHGWMEEAHLLFILVGQRMSFTLSNHYFSPFLLPRHIGFLSLPFWDHLRRSWRTR